MNMASANALFYHILMKATMGSTLNKIKSYLFADSNKLFTNIINKYQEYVYTLKKELNRALNYKINLQALVTNCHQLRYSIYIHTHTHTYIHTHTHIYKSQYLLHII